MVVDGTWRDDASPPPPGRDCCSEPPLVDASFASLEMVFFFSISATSESIPKRF